MASRLDEIRERYIALIKEHECAKAMPEETSLDWAAKCGTHRATAFLALEDIRFLLAMVDELIALVDRVYSYRAIQEAIARAKQRAEKGVHHPPRCRH